jgi:hypothetical protein
MPVTNIPAAPIFDPDLIADATTSLRSRQPLIDIHTSYEQSTVTIE